MYPVLFTIGGFKLYAYGAMLLLSFVGATALVIHLGEKQGHSRDDMMELATWTILAGIVGCRLGYVAQNLDVYLASPIQILNLRGGGMTLVTGLILGCFVLALFFRSKGIPFMNVLDLVSAPGLVGMAIGRIGCLLHGCCYGKVCQAGVPLAVTYPEGIINGLAGPRFPVQLYELGADLLLSALVLYSLPRVRFAGQAFYLTFGGYGLIRFTTEFFREGELMGSLTLAQWTSLAFALVCLLGWLGLFGKQKVVTDWKVS